MTRLPGPRKLAAFIKKHNISKTSCGRAVGVTHAAVIAWLEERAVPDDDHKDDLEVWTGGKVKADDWRTAEERKARKNGRNVEPFRPDPEVA